MGTDNICILISVPVQTSAVLCTNAHAFQVVLDMSSRKASVYCVHKQYFSLLFVKAQKSL